MSVRSTVVKLLNKLDLYINPATEDKQNTIITQLQSIAGFDIPQYDYIALLYVTSGNGIGEIGTATYMIGGSAGTVVAVLNLAYNASNEIVSVTKT